METLRQGLDSFERQLTQVDDTIYDYGFKPVERGLPDENFPEKLESVFKDFNKKDLYWEERPEERFILDKIENRVDKFVDESFGSVESILSQFYTSARVILTVDPDSGAPVYQSDPITGEFVEDWRQLTGQEAETAIWRIQRILDSIERETARLYGRAQFSYYSWDEEFWEEYKKPIAGTQYDRIATARSKTRESRFFYFAQYCFYYQVNERMQTLKRLQKRIEDAVQRRLYDRNQIYQD